MLPRKIEQQAAEAEALHRQVYGNPDEKKDEAPGNEKPESPPPETPPAADTKPEDAPPPKPDVIPEETWEQRFKVMEGKFKSEVPRYAEELRKEKAEKARLAAELEAAKAAKAAPAPEVKPEISPEMKEKYGDEFLSDMAKLLPSQPAPQNTSELANVTAEIERLKKEVAEANFARFKSDLTTKASQWEKLNTDSDFNTWLDGFDDLSGRPRRELFNDAVAQNNVDRTAVFFNSFGKQNQSMGDQTRSTVPPIEHSLAPNQSNAQPPQVGKKVWTVKEIETFYSDIRKGRISDADSARIEQDIFAAQKEGRIKG